MVNKHFFKVLIIFTIMIIFGLVGVFLISKLDKKEDKPETFAEDCVGEEC